MPYKDPDVARAKAREYSKRWRERNPDRGRLRMQVYRENNKEAINRKASEYRKAHPERVAEQRRRYRRQHTDETRAYHRNYLLKQKYGITQETYDNILRAQQGHCAICPAISPGGRCKFFHVDHDHETGQVRGLLCSRHNLMIGQSKDNPDILEAGAAYLRRHKQKE